MSRIARAQELARQLVDANKRKMPNRVQNISEQVLRTPTINSPGGLVAAGQAMRNIARSDAVGMGAGATILGGGAFALSQTDPNDLGRQMAQIDQPFYELMGQVQEKASDLAQIPQAYFMQVRQAYDDERQKQQEMQNIQEFGTFEEPEFIPESGEIKPVSVFMAGGGPFNVREILGESGRTLSNKQLEMLSNRNIREILGESGKTISNMDRAIAAGMGPAMMSDNEPRFEERSPENQMFSIDTAIGNLMTEYDMVVRNQEFERAQMIADQIDQLQQQKIQIQNQNVPQGRQEIDDILQSISI